MRQACINRERPWERPSLLGKPLSPCQREVLRLFASDYTTIEIALMLKSSPKTVEYHRQELYRKLGYKGIAGLTLEALRLGLIPNPCDPFHGQFRGANTNHGPERRMSRS